MGAAVYESSAAGWSWAASPRLPPLLPSTGPADRLHSKSVRQLRRSWDAAQARQGHKGKGHHNKSEAGEADVRQTLLCEVLLQSCKVL